MHEVILPGQIASIILKQFRSVIPKVAEAKSARK